MKKALVLALCAVAIGGCGEGALDKTTVSTTGEATPATRAEAILKASPWWKEYGITETEDIGPDGVYVYTSADPGDELAATDICNVVRELPNVVLVQVYDQNGDEIESERCGNVT